ncbi:MAG: 6-bladed beta-propeller [Bacteroidetes bacterium]|nr:6-bladed beta-propeller [Bacteroidota bacterium]
MELDALGADIQYEELKNGFLLMDSKDQKILLFSEEGNLSKIIGGSGRGPGEFLNLVAFAVGNGKIYAFDSSLWRLSTFDASSGEFINAVNVDEMLRIHDMVYADGFLYTFSGFTFSDLPHHVSVLNPEDVTVVNSFMEPSNLIQELDIPLSGAFRHIDVSGEKIVITHPLELRTVIYDLKGNLINEIIGESILYEEPNTDYQMMDPLHTAVSAMVISSRAISDKYFLEIRDLSPDESRGFFLEVFDYQGEKLNSSPISTGEGNLELIHITENEEFIFLERARNNNPKLLTFTLNYK